MAASDLQARLWDPIPGGATRKLRIAVLASRLDPALAGIRARALWPASLWRAAGHHVNFLRQPPNHRRLGRYDALVFIDPQSAADLHCCEQANELGILLIVDLSGAALSRANSGREPRDARSIVGRILELATIVTTSSSELARELAALVPCGFQVIVIPDPRETPAEKAALVRAVRGQLRAAGMRDAVAAIRKRWLSKHNPLAVLLWGLDAARSVPIMHWPTRVPSALARRFAALLAPAASPFSAGSVEPAAKRATAAKRLEPPTPATTAEAAAAVDRAAIARQWASVIETAVPKARATPEERGPARVGVLAFMDLIQDLDVLLPILNRLQTDGRFALTVAVTDWLDKMSPRVSRELTARSILHLIVTKKDVVKGIQPDLKRVNALITASESNHPAHRVPFSLVRRAGACGIPTYTLQHGLENVGLTYFEPYPDHDSPIEFASATILTWGPVEQLPADVSPTTRARCFAVGTPKPSEAPRVQLPLVQETGPVIAVFENLHWERYPGSYREAFIRDLRDVAAARRAMTFILKPHHAGLYLAKNRDLLADAPANVVLADPRVPQWEPYTAGAIIGSVDAVVTTPSTVALDAARAGRAVAVVGYGLDLPVYDPLPILAGSRDWLAFVDVVLAGGSHDINSRSAKFRERHIIEGDAVGRIIERIAADVAVAGRR